MENMSHSKEDECYIEEEENEYGNDKTTDDKEATVLNANDFLNQQFVSYEEVYECYVRYAKCVRFGVQKGDAAADSTGNYVRRKFLCNRAGVREKKCYATTSKIRKQKPETRTNCNAMLSIYLDKSCSMWKVRKIVEDHNHPLIPLKLVHQIPNHRTMTDADKAQVDSMHRHGLPPSKIMGLIAGQTGGYEFAGFTKKDLDNYVERNLRSKIIQRDVNVTLNYLHGKAEDEPIMIVRHSLTDDDKLEHLFWADDLSRFDYQYFGDVLAFDSTYRKNKYNRPLVIFSGTNHHRQTCIFCFGLLADEQTKSYKWLLDNFSEAMMNKHLSLVITDGDNAMKSAIEEVFPNATHRLCAWHLYKNAVSHIKDPEFHEKFKKCLYAKFECDEFEEYWHDMVERFNLVGNDWVDKQYRRKEQWATAYLSSKFCAGFRTTSRCEGINSFIQSFVDSKDSILALVQNLERALRDYRNNEIVAKFKTINGEHVSTTGLHSLERHAALVYTREMFWEILEEIKSVVAWDIVWSGSRSTTTEYKIIKYERPDHEYIVLYDQDTQKMVSMSKMG